jgi:hypothetical protein
MPIGYTERGFADYASFTDLYDTQVTVRESSLATEDAVWIFVDNGRWSDNPAAHLNREQAKTVIVALQEWLDTHPEESSSHDPT